MVRPIWTLAIVCALATACSEQTPPSGGDKSAASTAAASAATAPAVSTASAPSTATAASSATTARPGKAEALTRTPLQEITIPAGKRISISLKTQVASDTSKPEDPIRGTLAEPIVVSGTTVVPAGAEVAGTVVEANRSGRVKGRALVAFQFERLTVGDERHDIRTARIVREAAPNRRDDLKKGGIGAGVGAIVGGIVAGGKGAAIGAGAGGAGAVLGTRGSEIRLPAGTTVTTTLQEPITVSVPGGAK